MIYADIEMEEDYHPSANHQLGFNSLSQSYLPQMEMMQSVSNPFMA
jgi:hypothetical protein